MSSLVSEESIDTLYSEDLDRGRLEGVQVGLMLAFGQLELLDTEKLVFGDEFHAVDVDDESERTVDAGK